jgi:hypothetical protein
MSRIPGFPKKFREIRRNRDKHSEQMTGLYSTILRHRAWLVLFLLLLFVGAVRLRLLDMPLERDEGEYAYSGQLILQGIPPYKMAYNLKFPGIYATYALIMLLFGQSAAGIHFGLLVVNLCSIILVFFLGRRLLDLNGGLVAATTFALLSLSVSVLGLAAHASHFVVLAALGGTWLLLRTTGPRDVPARSSPEGARGLAGLVSSEPAPASNVQAPVLFASGALFGVAFLMKQPGIFWGIFGLLYLAFINFKDHRDPKTVRSSSARLRPVDWKKGLRRCAWYCLGLLTPFLLMCLALRSAGVFDRFLFWTFTYAREYASVNPLLKIPNAELQLSFRAVFGPNLALWLLALLGAVLMWWEARLQDRRLFIAGFCFVSLLAVCPGWYFRQHYFVFLLPAIALLAGIAVNRGLYLLRHDRTIELFLAVPLLGLFVVGLGASIIGNGSVWFELSPAAACRECYRYQMFPEDADVGQYIKTHAGPGTRVAVLGSEPEIYFYARRHSATGYIYTYPLMELHKYASKMQDEMIREIETARPDYLVFVKVDESWLMREQSDRKILDWYDQYSKTNYDLVRVIKESDDEMGKTDPLAGRTPGLLLLFERKR